MDNKYNYLNENEIKNALLSGLSENEIAKKIANNVSSAFEDYHNEKAKQEKEVQKRNKINSLRNKLIDSVIEYLTALGYKIEGDFRGILNKKFQQLENKDYPFPFIRWDLLW